MQVVVIECPEDYEHKQREKKEIQGAMNPCRVTSLGIQKDDGIQILTSLKFL